MPVSDQTCWVLVLVCTGDIDSDMSIDLGKGVITCGINERSQSNSNRQQSP